ncbi:hypothetical protein AVEN_245575-1 [Araneus ventricosus]|uniref:Uncharacterized protein n=1 Tax=Araneus ventricosus TaxID=182803 RepID=A0A4Y2H4M4_ARAVE|nr:hypothetical protein AVEN_245575-1 [Araneus ventricosus]
MEEIYSYLDGKDDCQYSAEELMEKIFGKKPTPSEALPPADSIKRLKSVPNAEDVGKLGVLELLTSENMKTSELQQIVAQDEKTFL